MRAAIHLVSPRDWWPWTIATREEAGSGCATNRATLRRARGWRPHAGWRVGSSPGKRRLYSVARASLVIRGMRLQRGVAWTVGGGLVMLTWLAVSAGGTDLASGQPARSKAAKGAVVDHVADGDTIQVAIRGREEDVRFIGIDTPEVYGGVECGGREASASMKRMLKPGDRVRLVRDRSQDNRDYYGRLLRYVELRGRDLGRKQIR
jgi:hypothetical protein